MTSVLMNADGVMESEAAHGTVTRHWRQYEKGLATSTNPIASIFAWSRGLDHRGKLDGNEDLRRFCASLEQAVLDAVEGGQYTKDLAILATGRHDVKEGKDFLVTEAFMDAVDVKFRAKWD